jgi:kinesin family protein C2/C3
MQSAFDGFNVTIFAYGQTGAGKTFTMSGGPDQPGLSPLMIDEIYRIVQKDMGRFEHHITTSMVELYRNELIDLLQLSQLAPPAKRASMRVDKEGAVYFDNVIEEEVEDREALADVFERGTLFRKTASTAMNSESSRSHLIQTIRIRRVNRETGHTTKGKILLVDLAGSERLKKSLVMGDVKKDSIEINKSLTALGDVIEALTQGHPSIPYRNHKLTQVLQDALGRSAKTLMFVHCSPAKSSLEETLATVKYATRAKKIKRCVTPRAN